MVFNVEESARELLLWILFPQSRKWKDFVIIHDLFSGVDYL